MRPGRTRPRLLALLLVPLLVVVGLGRAEAFYLCVGDEVARATCCCPTADTAQDGPAAPASWTRATCCSIDKRGAPAPVARSAERDGAPSIAAVQLAVVPAPPAAAPVADGGPRPIRSGPAPRTASRSSQHVVLLL